MKYSRTGRACDRKDRNPWPRFGPFSGVGGQQFVVALAALEVARATAHGLLHFLEGANLDLADALAADAEFPREFLQGHRILGQAACLEDAALAIIQDTHRVAQQLAAV